MKQELLAYRDLAYSAFHREESLRRFLTPTEAASLAMIDIDCAYVEYDHNSKRPLILVEIARDCGQSYKTATVITNLARAANLPAYAVLYAVSERGNPADRRFADLEGFRIRRLHPRPETNWRRLSPKQWALALVKIRTWSAKRLAALDPANDPKF
jgi:hypothetical protein